MRMVALRRSHMHGVMGVERPGTGSTLSLSASVVQPTDEVVCEVTATDVDSGTDSATDTVTVENTAPTVDTISIAPSGSVTTSTTLTCTATGSDVDLESPVISYEWADGAGSIVGTGASYTLTPSAFAPGDSITCIATATDGYSGTDSDRLTVSVDNTLPVLSSVTLRPSSTAKHHVDLCTGHGHRRRRRYGYL